MIPYSTASLGLKYFGRLMSASTSSGDFPTCFARRLTLNKRLNSENVKYINHLMLNCTFQWELNYSQPNPNATCRCLNIIAKACLKNYLILFLFPFLHIYLIICLCWLITSTLEDNQISVCSFFCFPTFPFKL